MIDERTARRGQQTVQDIADAIGFLTRFSVPGGAPDAESPARSAWAFPLVGAGIGLAGGAVLTLGLLIGLPALVAAALAVAATVALTGALHEDGLADTFDGFGGRTQERRLAIMSDSRIGTFGVVALVLTLTIRIATIAALGRSSLAAGVTALIAAETLARAIMVALWAALPPAKPDGLAATAGSPSRGAVVYGAVTALCAWLVALAFAGRPMAVLAAAVFAMIAAYMLSSVLLRTIGGRTGDTLGASQQIALVAFLVAASIGQATG